MAIEVKAPQPLWSTGPHLRVFLAGSIDMGTAEDWQARVASALSPYNVVLLNPRRDNWDSTWIQSKDNPKFREQVEWEGKAIEVADMVLFVFLQDSKAPISLLEFGKCLNRSKRVFVYCPTGFYRKGNIDIEAERANIPVYEDLDAMLVDVKSMIEKILRYEPQ